LRLDPSHQTAKLSWRICVWSRTVAVGPQSPDRYTSTV